jgi:DNA modification methylase
MKTLPDNSVDAIVTDPPYGISFMSKKWDYDVPSEEVWQEALRVLKPGGHLLSFASTRTQHRMAVNIEDAGFEIRDMLAWVHGEGFPKSQNISKAIDKMNGEKREVIKTNSQSDPIFGGNFKSNQALSDTPISEQAKEWDGYGTCLKPALEPITLARKPIEKGLTIAENCLKWGTGGLNIDGCRVELTTDEDTKRKFGGGHKTKYIGGVLEKNYEIENQSKRDLGRFPANLLHDGSEEVLTHFPSSKSSGAIRINTNPPNRIYSKYKPIPLPLPKDSGSNARFFYCTKAKQKEREMGSPETRNNHPTVKPLMLMQYLIKLISTPSSIILDPYAGSGTTLLAAKNLGLKYIGIEREQDYVEIINARLNNLAE